MNVSRLLLILLFAPLLTNCSIADDLSQVRKDVKLLKSYVVGGRSENPCVLGVRQTAECYYVVEITNNTETDGVYEGKISVLACEQNKASGHEDEDCSLFDPVIRQFPIKGSPNYLVRNHHYEFDSQVTRPTTAQLVCRNQGGTPDPTGQQCGDRARNNPLPVPK
jgi:hypothetical protein